MSPSLAGNMEKPRLLDQVRSVIRVRHYSRRIDPEPRPPQEQAFLRTLFAGKEFVAVGGRDPRTLNMLKG
jgi:hypothetical protein